jgi:hypothetical protein
MQMRDPARVARLWVALAVATLWVISVGSELELGPSAEAVDLPDLRPLLGVSAQARPRRTRLFRLGWLWVLVQAIRGRAVPLPTRLDPEPWPEVPEQLFPTVPLQKRLAYAYTCHSRK